jgi:RNA polymerase sigma factor (TIGR02999 family)
VFDKGFLVLQGDVTKALQELRDGRRSAAERLLPVVYEELRALAGSFMRRQAQGHTLEPTALVHEACAKMLGSNANIPEDRVHFFAIAATAMRQILSNHARAKRAAKRAPAGERINFGSIILHDQDKQIDLLDLDDALTELMELDRRQARVVELRFLAGMTISETASALGISTASVEREWRVARAWMAARLTAGHDT